MQAVPAIFSILYVEDSDHLREMIGALMEGDDREVVLCASGEEALQACAHRQFDLVVTDVSLPGISGTELARQLLLKKPDLWIALCSGYGFGDRLGTLGLNVRALDKPFELEQLDALIAEVIQAHRSAAQ